MHKPKSLKSQPMTPARQNPARHCAARTAPVPAAAPADQEPKTPTKSHGFWGRASYSIKSSWLPTGHTPQKLKDAILSDEMVRSPSKMVAVEGAKDANGNIVSPIVLKTPGGTAYTKFCIVKTQDGSCRKLFGQIDPLEDATASAPKTKRKSTGKAKEVSPNTTPYTEIKKKLKLVPSSDIVVAQKSVDKSVIKRCSNRKRVSTVTLLGASAAEIRAAFTAEHTGKPNRKSADWSHMIPHSQGGENEKGGVTSPRHNTARLLTVEHLTRHLAVEKDLKLDVECAAEFMRDSSGDLTLLMSKENNTVVARDVKAGKSSTFSIDFPDAQLDGAVPKSLLHLSKNLVMFGNYQTLVPKSDRGAKRKASDASPAATTSTPPAQPVKRPRHST